GSEWDLSAFGMALPQCTVWSVVHDDKGSTRGRIDTEIDNRDDMWVLETETSCFVEEGGSLFIGETEVQDLDGNLGVTIDIFGEVDVAESALSEQVEQAVSVDLLARAVCHKA